VAEDRNDSDDGRQIDRQQRHQKSAVVFYAIVAGLIGGGAARYPGSAP